MKQAPNELCISSIIFNFIFNFYFHVVFLFVAFICFAFSFFFFADLLLAGAPAQHDVGDALGEEALSYCARVTCEATAATPSEQAPALCLCVRCASYW
jgi:hypothetical protein